MSSAILPTPRQLEFQSWQTGLFLHFGIRTFYEGHVDWDRKPMAASAFNPTDLDCRQWVRVAKEAGFRYMVLTAKHHDGFANWPSGYTDYSVAATPWKGGKGDVIAEYVQACREQDMKVGIYYSPGEWLHPAFGTDAAAYDEYMFGQFEELLSGYGPIDVLWLDGCGSEQHTYDWPRIMDMVRKHQPEVMVFNMGDPDYRWIGNECGIAPDPCWNVVERIPFSILQQETEQVAEGQPVYLPAECDARLRHHNWFFSENDVHTIKSVEELMTIYDYSVGRGCNLLLNVGPDRRGLIPELDAARLVEFGDAIRERQGRAAADLDDFQQTDATTWTWTPESPRLVECVMAGEDLSGGERVRGFEVLVEPEFGGEACCVFRGESLGQMRIASFPPITARSVIFRLTACDGDAVLSRLQVIGS